MSVGVMCDFCTTFLPRSRGEVTNLPEGWWMIWRQSVCHCEPVVLHLGQTPPPHGPDCSPQISKVFCSQGCLEHHVALMSALPEHEPGIEPSPPSD